jgi:hypothetical protein
MTVEDTPMVRSARWSSRLATFSVSLLLLALGLHRIAVLPTPLAINLFLVGLAGAGLAVLIALGALARIWSTGDGGAGSALLGLVLGGAALAGPVGFAAMHADLPPINDVTTDTANPPAFQALAKRPPGANPVAYPGRSFAALQAQGYPDLHTLVLDRSAEDVFELVDEAVRRLRWRVVVEDPPTIGKGATPGTIEATEQTLLVGFTDDIVIRIVGNATQTRVDARSASRYGSFDFGQNAQRVRRLLAEIRARVEVTPSAAMAAAIKEKANRKGAARALLKRPKAHGLQKAESRNARAPSKSGARRAPAQKKLLPW